MNAILLKPVKLFQFKCNIAGVSPRPQLPRSFLTLPPQMSNAPLHNPCMKTANQFMQVQIQVPEDQFTAQAHRSTQLPHLPINDALQIKAAEYWLKLGEADQALKELEALPTRTWKCGWAIKTRIA